MSEDERTACVAAPQSERRSTPRQAVDEAATILVVSHGATIACRMLDLSLGGCRLCTWEPFQAGTLARVEVSFRVQGLAFRLSGVTQWTKGRRQAGIRFVDMPLRRRAELAEALRERREEQAAGKGAEEQASEEQTQEKQAPEQTEGKLRKRTVVAMIAEQPGPVPKPAETAPAEKPLPHDRRAQSRHEVDSSAVLHLINVGSRLHGRILDLSLGGCHIRTDERFPVGIYTRVETEFRLEGLPFRLGGVIQAIRDRQNVGIRFLDMSDRKREQVEQLIEEMEEQQESREAAKPEGSTNEGIKA
jgi:c-di-GMP-binding flagellar brake protein YcgR